MGALCKNLGNFALNSFDDTSLLVDGHVLHFFFDSCLHLDTVLKLLAYCYFITSRHHGFDVVLEVGLVETDDVLSLSGWDAQVEMLVTNIRVLIVNDEPMPKSVENNFVEVFRFYLPVAYHARRESIPLGLGNMESAWVVVWVIGPAFGLV